MLGAPSRRSPALFVLGALGALVSGHAVLVESSPRDGEALATPPPVAVLRFNVRIERRLTRVALTGPDGRAIALPAAQALVEDPPGRLSIPLPPLAPGAYRLTYVVMAADGHATPGLVRFTVERGPSR
jgi:methionine-rich copper-binding protein CopC